MAETSPAERVEHALGTLDPRHPVRDNAFGVTGLPVDFTARQLRRVRSECRSESYEPLAGYPHAPVSPATDPDRLQVALDHLVDPVIRFVHEMLWVDGDPGSAQTRAVRSLETAAEVTDELLVGGFTVGGLEAGDLDLWDLCLRSWAVLLGEQGAWNAAAKARMERIDDPRLSTGIVRALRFGVPGYILGIAADSAAAVARERSADGRRLALLVDLSPTLAGSGFTFDEAERALREAAAAEVAAIRSLCDPSARRPSGVSAIQLARTVLEETAAPMDVVRAVIGTADPIAIGCADEVVLAVNRCTLEHAREHFGLVDLGPLRAAVELGPSETIEELVRENLRVLEPSQPAQPSQPSQPARPRSTRPTKTTRTTGPTRTTAPRRTSSGPRADEAPPSRHSRASNARVFTAVLLCWVVALLLLAWLVG